MEEYSRESAFDRFFAQTRCVSMSTSMMGGFVDERGGSGGRCGATVCVGRRFLGARFSTGEDWHPFSFLFFFSVEVNGLILIGF